MFKQPESYITSPVVSVTLHAYLTIFSWYCTVVRCIIVNVSKNSGKTKQKATNLLTVVKDKAKDLAYLVRTKAIDFKFVLNNTWQNPKK